MKLPYDTRGRGSVAIWAARQGMPVALPITAFVAVALLALFRSPLDEAAADAVARFVTTPIDAWVTKLGSVEALTIVALITVATLVACHRRRDAALTAASVAGGAALSFVMKLILHREKPLVAGADAPLRVPMPRVEVVAMAGCLLVLVGGLVVVATVAIHRRGWWWDLALALISIMPLVIDTAVKSVLDAADAGHPASFPSAHALNTAALALAVAVVAWPTRLCRPVAAVALLVTVAVGFTRVSLSEHHATDVLAGWMLGVAWTAALIRAVFGAPGALSWSGQRRSSRPRPDTA